MISPERAAVLQSFLGSLPEHVAARLAQAVEVDRLVGGSMLPHEMILEGLRPALRRADNLKRTPTPIRMFCQPFEDLLTSMPQKEKQKGRIARASVAPVWNWLNKTLLPEATKSYAGDVKALVLAGKHDEAIGRAALFWRAASEAIRGALASDAGRKAARATLQGEAVVADADEMALLLAAGLDFVEVQKKMPKPVAAMTDDLLWALRAIYDRVLEIALDAAPYVAVIAMYRLARPWEALKLPQLVTRQSQDTLMSSTDMGLAGDLIFGEIELHGNAIRAARHPKFDPDELVEHLASFAELSGGMVKEVEIRRDGKWGQRLLKDRAAIAEVMDGFMERAPKEILATLPVLKSGGPRSPDFGRGVDLDKVELAKRYARLIVGCRPFAAAASFGARLKDAVDEVSQHLQRYTDDVVKEMRTAEGPRRVIVEQRFATIAELTALLFSEEEAELLRRRGRAALQAAA